MYYDIYETATAIPTILIVTAVIGLIFGIVLLVVFLPAKNRGKYGGAAKWFYDFLNFHKFWISGLVKILNVMVLTVCILGGFICLFIPPHYTGLILWAMAIIYRILLELIMVTLSIRDNVSQIADAMFKNNGQQIPPAKPNPEGIKTCSACGTPADPDSKFCMKCGSAL